MDCFNHSCPFRVNETSNANRCECLACQHRGNSDFIITSNRTLTNDELAMLVALRNGDKKLWRWELVLGGGVMTEYIKREDAIDAVLDVYCDTPNIDLSCEKFEAAILKIPAADVVPVVRCKDCRLRGREECAMFYRCECGEQHTWETDNDFCSWAKRRDRDNA